MDRKNFLRTGLLGTGILVGGSAAAHLLKNDIDELRLWTLSASTIYLHHP